MPELASALDSVTVFPDRARVTRRGTATLEPGVHRLEISNLPMSLLPDSVRASGKGTARARLLGVSLQVRNYVDTPAEAARELEAKIQAVMDADADLAAQAGVLERAQKAIDGLAEQSEMFARGLALRDRSTADQGAVFDFIDERGRALQTDLLAVGRKRRDLAKELDRLRRELAQIQSARPRQRYAATVEVEAVTGGNLEIELTYVVQPARWQPLYDLRLTGGELEMTYLGEVAQSTGEDWAGVAMTLSTARPALALVIPELDPWYIGPRPAPPQYSPKMQAIAGAAPAPMAMHAMAEEALDLEAEETFMELPSATVSESGAAVTYQISSRADVPSSGEPRKVTVSSFKLRPELDAVTAPKLEPVCYRRAKVRNDSPYTLLPGRAQLFEGEEYLGATQIELVAPGQELELALGADERLRVERKLVAREVEKTLLADRRRIRYRYRIEVENLRDTPQVVFVRDQLPVSRHEQIKVKLEASDPKPSEHSGLNQLEWKLTLPPSAKQIVQFEHSVESPRSLDVVGLE
ncbi:MAG TPA: mucoidy inhibitor MuiA family protein [Thermoanaerobaculia bacterium]